MALDALQILFDHLESAEAQLTEREAAILLPTLAGPSSRDAARWRAGRRKGSAWECVYFIEMPLRSAISAS